jgi:hypothetical protein
VVDVERVKVSRVITREEATELVGSPVEERPPTVSRATWTLDADSGEPVLGYWPLGDVADLRAAVRGVDIRETYRAASGRRNASRVFGWSPRRPVQRREACNSTSLAKEQPAEQAVLDAWAVRLLDQLRELDPAVADRDEATMREVLPEWRMAGTTWTSGVVNQNSQLPYHRDGFNFPTWSAMPVLRRGVEGGHLHLPEYDLTVACRDGWGVFFCGQQLVHGVTPMRRTAPDGYRFSVVYYALRGMKDCHTYAEETAHARRRRTEREKGMAAAGATLDVTSRQARPALQAWLADNHPVPAYVKLLTRNGVPVFAVASELDPGLTEWAGVSVEWNLDPAEGRGKTDLVGPDRTISTAAGQLPTQAAVAVGLPVAPDDPAGLTE